MQFSRALSFKYDSLAFSRDLIFFSRKKSSYPVLTRLLPREILISRQEKEKHRSEREREKHSAIT